MLKACKHDGLQLAGAFHCPLKIVNTLTAPLKDDIAG